MDAAPLSWYEALAAVPDPRSRSGRSYPLTARLHLISVALRAGQRALEAIAPLGRDHGTPLAHALGFPSDRTPCQAPLSNLLRRLDGTAFEPALLRGLHARCPDLGDRLALEGQTLRGTASSEVPGAPLRTAYAPQVAAVVGQLRIDGKANEPKAAWEWLGVGPLRGQGVTGDARFGHRDCCEQVREGGGDSLLTVTDNPPQLPVAIASRFAEASAFSPLPTAALAGGAR